MKQSILLGLLFCSLSARADSLVDVYQQAIAGDPIFAQAKSTWQAQQLNLPIAQAGYLPSISATGYADRDYSDSTVLGSGYSWRYNYNIALSQPIFNLQAWNAIKNASALVKSATATYLSAQQDLMVRTAQAYFNVLKAYDQLRYTIANKKAVYQQLVTAQEKFKVGLIAITDVYDARSQYDQVLAQEISAKNNLNIQLEALRALTGLQYGHLKMLGTHLPLLKPQPANIDQWMNIAIAQNYAIQAQNYAVLAAMDNIKMQAAAGYPTMSLTGAYGTTYTRGNSTIHGNDTEASLGLSMSYQMIQGGLISASTEQARYQYVTAAANLEQVKRNTVNQTRSNYLSILSGIGQIKADEQSIISAKNAVQATQAGLEVGTRTMVDLLSDLSSLYQTQQQYATDQYDYMMNIINLKAAAGTLSATDLQQINNWLTQTVVIPGQTKMAEDSITQAHDNVQKKNTVLRKQPRKVAIKHPVVTAHHIPAPELDLPAPA